MSVVDDFNREYYDSQVWRDKKTKFLGVPIAKYPTDLWVYQEIIFDCKPDTIIETGTFQGGSALFLAHVCDMVGNGKVITVDVHEDGPYGVRPDHDRVTYLFGDSASEDVVKEVKDLIEGEKIMVLLDSDHKKSHVLRELAAYADLVSFGSYLIVEDTNINGHPVNPGFGEGPFEAVQEFLKGRSDFVVDKDKERFMLTANPGGFLRRVK